MQKLKIIFLFLLPLLVFSCGLKSQQSISPVKTIPFRQYNFDDNDMIYHIHLKKQRFKAKIQLIV